MLAHPTCTICHSARLLTVRRYLATPGNDNGWRGRLIKGGNLPIRLVLCARCGFLFYRDVPDYREMASLYSEEARYEQMHDTIADESEAGRRKELQRGIDFLLRYCTFKEGSTIIDVGAGDFLVVDALLSKHPKCKYEALDPSYHERSYGKVQVHRTMLEEFVPKRRYDLVSLIHVLEHVSDLNTFMAKLGSLVKPGGQLFIEIPFLVGPGLFLTRSVNTQHLNYFTPASFRNLLSRHGFRIAAEEFDTDTYPFNGMPGMIRVMAEKTPQPPAQNRILSLAQSAYFLLSPAIFLRSAALKGRQT